MLFRAEVRTTAIELLQAGIIDKNAKFYTSKDTPVETGQAAPEIIVYTDDRKIGTGGTPPQFKTEVQITVEITNEGDDVAGAETLNDTLCELVENILLGSPEFVKLFEGIDGVESVTTHKGDGASKHTFTTVYEIKAHVSEIFEPRIDTPLTGVNIYVDSIEPRDANGTYEKPFNYPVADAPRTEGPDGRVEISGKLDIPQE